MASTHSFHLGRMQKLRADTLLHTTRRLYPLPVSAGRSGTQTTEPRRERREADSDWDSRSYGDRDRRGGADERDRRRGDGGAPRGGQRDWSERESRRPQRGSAYGRDRDDSAAASERDGDRRRWADDRDSDGAEGGRSRGWQREGRRDEERAGAEGGGRGRWAARGDGPGGWRREGGPRDDRRSGGGRSNGDGRYDGAKQEQQKQQRGDGRRAIGDDSDGPGGRRRGDDRFGARADTASAKDDEDVDVEYDDVEVDDAEEEEFDRERQGVRRGGRQLGGAGAAPPLRDSLQGEALYGVFPVLAALRAKRRKVHRAFLLESIDLSKRKDAGLVRQVESLCGQSGVQVVRTGRHELNLMSHDRPHQGLVLDVSPLDWTNMDEFPLAADVMAATAAAADTAQPGSETGVDRPQVKPPVWLALDEVVDPQNLGAVVRSAYCLGAAGVLACSKNCAPLSPTVSKASAGALEAIPLHSCHNLPRTLIDARDNKGWAVLGAAAGSGSVPVSAVAVTRPTILVLGSEGLGLRTNVRRACSGLVRVEMATATATAGPRETSGNGATAAIGAESGLQVAAPPSSSLLRGLVDSLNVSVATGILLHSLLSSASGASGASGARATGEGASGAAEPAE